jgi:tRNA pseudouridine13 synthase
MLTLSKGRKMACRVKSQPEDFVVEEIASNGTVLERGLTYSAPMLCMEDANEGKFSIFVMQKSNWNTLQALKAVARKLYKGIRSMGFAGTKDRMSVSTQLCSLYGAAPSDLMQIHIKDVSINGAWRGAEKIKLGELLGNRFTITAREIKDCGEIEEIGHELNGVFPNYFGEQRFGIRENNVEIGLSLLKGDFKGAAMTLLTDTSNERNEAAVQARKRLCEELDFKMALQYFPQYLKYERLIIEHLSRYPENYANAIRRLPRSLSLMFIHSVEAFIFNKELEDRIAKGDTEPSEGDTVCRPNAYGFCDLSTAERYSGQSGNGREFIVANTIGHDTKEISEFESSMLDGMGITPESFKVKGMSELNSKGARRVLFAPYKDLSHTIEAEGDSAAFRFSLPAGSYATVLLNEFVEDSAPSEPGEPP